MFWSQLASFLIYSCLFISLCSPFSCLVIAVPCSPQGVSCSVLRGEACVCVNQPSHSLHKWPSLSFSRCVSQIIFLHLSMYTSCIQGSHHRWLQMHNSAKSCENTVFPLYIFLSLKGTLLLMLVLFANPYPCWALKPALYNNKICYCCLNANKWVSERSGKPDCADYGSSGSTQINVNYFPSRKKQMGGMRLSSSGCDQQPHDCAGWK